jgi:hypothetical protein
MRPQALSNPLNVVPLTRSVRGAVQDFPPVPTFGAMRAMLIAGVLSAPVWVALYLLLR